MMELYLSILLGRYITLSVTMEQLQFSCDHTYFCCKKSLTVGMYSLYWFSEETWGNTGLPVLYTSTRGSQYIPIHTRYLHIAQIDCMVVTLWSNMWPDWKGVLCTYPILQLWLSITSFVSKLLNWNSSYVSRMIE